MPTTPWATISPFRLLHGFLRRRASLRAGHLWGRRAQLMSEVAPLKEERHIDQADHHGHFDQWPDNGGKSRAGVDPKDGYGYRERSTVID